MAKRINLDKYGAGIFKRTEMYAAQVSKQFESAVERLLKLTRSVELGEGELFTFSYNNRIGREANAILRDLYANVYQQIKNGATMEWEYANLSADAMIRSIFGKVANDNHFARYFLRNQEAMDAFFERKTAGLNLSQRVWNCTGQLKDEMELALSVAMGKGESASTISRQVRQYLQEPNKLFRRVRDEQGNLKLSKAAKAYHPGQGVYRSSYKNAMRLTRTETNMAYRSADHERWQRMDFVIGIEIHTSGNHPDEDICDELAGVYPKDFKFVGWHPQCRCFATPLLADEQDMMDWSEKVMRGEAGINDFKAQQITEMPENFTKWMEENADRIENAAHKPYFLTDNEDVINRKELTPQEIAEQRHAMRTPEDEQTIRDAWAARREENRLIDLAANNMLKVAADYGETDVTALEKAMQFGELNAVQRQTKALAQQILGIKQEEQALSSLIPNAHAWHQQFTMAELQSVYSAVESKLMQWSTLPLEQQAKKLQFEAVDFLGGNMKGVQQKYPTWKVSQAAYLNQLDKVNYQLAVDKINQQLAIIEQWSMQHTASKNVAKFLQEAKDAIAAGEDIASIQAKADHAEIVYKKRLAEQARRDRKKLGQTVSPNFDADAYSQERKNNAMWAKNTADADARLRDKCGLIWRGATEAEKDAIYGYTSSYCNINEPLRGLTYIGSQESTRTGLRRIPHITDIINRSSYDFDMWLQRGDTRVALKKFGLANWDTATNAEIKALVGKTGTEGAFWSAGVAKGEGFSSKEVIFNIYAPKGTKAMYCEPFSAFGSGSGRGWDGLAKQTSFYESEILLQRGTTFRITKVEITRGKIYIDVDVIAQDVLPFPYQNGFPYK